MANFLKTVRQLFSSPSPSPNSDVIVIDDDDEGITKNRLSQFLKTGQLSTFLLSLENSQTLSKPPKKKSVSFSPPAKDWPDVEQEKELNKYLDNPDEYDADFIQVLLNSLEISHPYEKTPVPAELEKFISGSERDHVTTAVGLQNPSNYCFANALFQVLASFQPFNDDVLQACSQKHKDITFIKYLQGILQYLRSPKKTLQEPIKTLQEPINVDFLTRFCKEGKQKLKDGSNKNAFIKICPNLSNRNKDNVPSIRQGDSIELLKYLFLGLQGFNQSKGNAISLAERNCIVQYALVISCRYSAYKSQAEFENDTGFAMPAPRGEENYSIIDFLNEIEFITQAKHLQSDPETLCPRFKNENDVKKEIKDRDGNYKTVDRDDLNNHTKQNIYIFPLTTTGLFFEIKRNIFGEKNNIAIIFPEVLKKDGVFSLCGFIVHLGGANGGHYVAYALRDKKWYYFNDNFSPVLFENINGVICKDSIQRGVASIFYNRVT